MLASQDLYEVGILVVGAEWLSQRLGKSWHDTSRPGQTRRPFHSILGSKELLFKGRLRPSSPSRLGHPPFSSVQGSYLGTAACLPVTCRPWLPVEVPCWEIDSASRLPVGERAAHFGCVGTADLDPMGAIRHGTLRKSTSLLFPIAPLEAASIHTYTTLHNAHLCARHSIHRSMHPSVHASIQPGMHTSIHISHTHAGPFAHSFPCGCMHSHPRSFCTDRRACTHQSLDN